MVFLGSLLGPGGSPGTPPGRVARIGRGSAGQVPEVWGPHEGQHVTDVLLGEGLGFRVSSNAGFAQHWLGLVSTLVKTILLRHTMLSTPQW